MGGIILPNIITNQKDKTCFSHSLDDFDQRVMTGFTFQDGLERLKS